MSPEKHHTETTLTRAAVLMTNFGFWNPEARFPLSLGEWGIFKKKSDEKPTSQFIPATKRKIYLFSKIPNYERQNLAGRCALLSLS